MKANIRNDWHMKHLTPGTIAAMRTVGTVMYVPTPFVPANTACRGRGKNSENGLWSQMSGEKWY